MNGRGGREGGRCGYGAVLCGILVLVVAGWLARPVPGQVSGQPLLQFQLTPGISPVPDEDKAREVGNGADA